ncbi:MAG: SulP family inorganic anion transporter [Pseudomonadales bacterium]|jgi:SulP family sulfate permease|nr:SulP family inorganic anion transporter [Pseudomonadales bacterium]MCP5321517.1 SulP family inorganic anion transporter [Pseudomonadales bacterium]MCP5336430.1 SulP family inorganic anion transporter [Pseudomonadales bacterium]
MRPSYLRIPALEVLRGYRTSDARGDLLAGLSVAAVAVPQAMAYAMVVGLPPEVGLCTAIIMTAVGAVFDSSRQLINGPTNAISIALLSAVGAIVDPGERLQAVVLMAFMIGSIQLGISLLRLGDLTRYISHSVIVGFTAGASLLLVLDQLKNLLGQRAVGDVHDHFLLRVYHSLVAGGDVHQPTVYIGLASITLVVALRWLKRRWSWVLLPEFLLVVLVMAGLSAYFDFAAMGVKVVGTIPATLPRPEMPVLDVALMEELATPALAIALLGLLEAISMSKAIAAVTRQKLDLNQQCLSEGMANIVGSFFSCMPGSGSLTRSAINQQAGARTQWSGVISAIAVAVVMVVLAPYAAFIPRPALAGLLIVTAAGMINFHDLRFHLRVTRYDAIIVTVTAVTAFAISIEFCILIGTFLSFMLAVPRAGNMHMTEFIPAEDGIVHERLPEDDACPRIRIYGFEGEFFFAAGTNIERHMERIEEQVDANTQVVVLRMKRARNPDAVGMAQLEGLCDRLSARGIRVLLCGVRPQMHQVMQRCGIIGKIGTASIFLEQNIRQTSTMQAMHHAATLSQGGCGSCPLQGERPAPHVGPSR